MTILLEGCPVISVGDIETAAVDYTDWLASGELLTGTPTITEVGSSDLTLSNKTVNTGAEVIKGRTVAIGAAVQCSVQGQTAGKTYRLKITVSTDASPARTINRELKFKAE